GGAFVSRGQRELYTKTWAHCKRGAGGKPAPYGCAASGGAGCAVSEERGFAGVGGVSHAARDTSRGTAG
ncbi:MAG: hypothetical protein IKO55_07985, partial [Kiritimatiellae bacterium]|nr:hypothetical protein [Kiritimatiellia bacterium]